VDAVHPSCQRSSLLAGNSACRRSCEAAEPVGMGPPQERTVPGWLLPVSRADTDLHRNHTPEIKTN